MSQCFRLMTKIPLKIIDSTVQRLRMLLCEWQAPGSITIKHEALGVLQSSRDSSRKEFSDGLFGGLTGGESFPWHSAKALLK